MELAVAGQIRSQPANALPGTAHTAQLHSGYESHRTKRLAVSYIYTDLCMWWFAALYPVLAEKNFNIILIYLEKECIQSLLVG